MMITNGKEFFEYLSQLILSVQAVFGQIKLKDKFILEYSNYTTEALLSELTLNKNEDLYKTEKKNLMHHIKA